jgi:hypothetical protein
MFEKIKRWHQKRQEQRAIRYGFRIVRSIIPNVEYTLKYCCLKTLAQLLDDYCATWGNDRFSQFYRDRLNYLQMFPCKGSSV